MRLQIILLALIFPTLTTAAPKEAPTLLKESQQLRSEAAKEKSFEKKLKKFKDFETSLKSTIKDHETASPIEGGDEEEKVVKFSYRFEPLFDLAPKKPSAKECEKTKHQIEFEDKSGKPEDAKLTETADEALKWLEVLCK